MQLDLPPIGTLEKPQYLDYSVLFDGSGESIIKRVASFRGRSLTGEFHCNFLVCRVFRHKSHDIICQKMLQQKMEAMAVVRMAQVTEFMDKHIVLKDFRETDYVKIQIDVSFI